MSILHAWIDLYWEQRTVKIKCFIRSGFLKLLSILYFATGNDIALHQASFLASLQYWCTGGHTMLKWSSFRRITFLKCPRGVHIQETLGSTQTGIHVKLRLHQAVSLLAWGGLCCWLKWAQNTSTARANSLGRGSQNFSVMLWHVCKPYTSTCSQVKLLQEYVLYPAACEGAESFQRTKTGQCLFKWCFGDCYISRSWTH